MSGKSNKGKGKNKKSHKTKQTKKTKNLPICKYVNIRETASPTSHAIHVNVGNATTKSFLLTEITQAVKCVNNYRKLKMGIGNKPQFIVPKSLANKKTMKIFESQLYELHQIKYYKPFYDTFMDLIKSHTGPNITVTIMEHHINELYERNKTPLLKLEETATHTWFYKNFHTGAPANDQKDIDEEDSEYSVNVSMMNRVTPEMCNVFINYGQKTIETIDLFNPDMDLFIQVKQGRIDLLMIKTGQNVDEENNPISEIHANEQYVIVEDSHFKYTTYPNTEIQWIAINKKANDIPKESIRWLIERDTVVRIKK